MDCPLAPPPTWTDPPLSGFSDRLRRSARLFSKPAGSVIFLMGQRPWWMYFVASGNAVMSRTDVRGRTVILQRANRSFLADATLTSRKYHCDAYARTATELLAFPLDVMRAAIDTDAATRWAWISMLAAETRRQRAQIERLALKTVRERLLHKLAESSGDGKLELRGPKTDLAAELGVTHEALYRTIAELKREGMLHEEGNLLQLL